MQFISQDGLSFKIDHNALKHCTKLNNTNIEVLNLNTITSNILSKVIQYLEIHKDDDYSSIPKIPTPLISNIIYDVVCFKDAKFITQLDLEQLFQIIQVADVLGINSLVDLSCAYIALQIRGKSSEQILKMINNNQPQTDEEVQKQRDLKISAKGLLNSDY